MSPLTNSGLPIATMRMSASRVTDLISRVREWHTVTVAFPPGPSWSSSAAMGRPTMVERPTITACFPVVSTSLLSRSCCTPYGVAGRNPEGSPTDTAASPGITPLALSSRISPWSSARIASPMVWPSISLAGKIHRPGLADDDHLDLARVLELALDLAGDLIRQLARLGVVDGVRGYDDAHLASRLDRDHLLHTGEVARDLLELGEPLHVCLERFAPRPGARARDGVRGLNDHADRRLVRHVVVVRGDAVDDDGMLAVLRGDFDAQLHVGAVVLVRQHLPDVVEQRAALGELRVELQLRRHDPREPGHFLRVLQDVLSVGRAVLHAAHELHELRVHPLDAGLVDRLLARLEDARLDLGPGLADHLFDAARVNATIGDQPLQGEPRDLTADGIEAGDDHRVRSVVDDHVHTRRRLESADVAALAADDAALHFVRREGHGRDGRLRCVLGGEALDGEREDLLRILLSVAARLFLQIPHQRRRLAPRLVLEAPQQLLLRFHSGET